MPAGVLSAVIAYAVYACGDALIKGVGPALSVFEIVFFSTLFSVVPAMVTKPKSESWLRFWQMQHPFLVQLRALSGAVGTLCMSYALTHIPIAETYSLVFLTPVLVVIISALVLGEQVRRHRWLLLALSFTGVLLVVRPGFRDLGWGHLAAVGCAFCGAITTSVLRTVSASETRVSLIGVVAGYSLALNLVLMLPTFQVPTVQQFTMLLVAGLCGGVGHLLFINATRLSPANQIAPVQYTQLIWGVLLSVALYREFPDRLALGGVVLILFAGIGNVLLPGRIGPAKNLALPQDTLPALSTGTAAASTVETGQPRVQEP